MKFVQVASMTLHYPQEVSSAQTGMNLEIWQLFHPLMLDSKSFICKLVITADVFIIYLYTSKNDSSNILLEILKLLQKKKQPNTKFNS